MSKGKKQPGNGAAQREQEMIAAAWRESSELVNAANLAPPPSDRIDGYRLLRELGRGGMGVVYEAEQDQPRRAVALKMIGGALADHHRVRLFEREVETLARLRHPAIASIYEAGRTSHGRHYFTMELVRGVRLTEYVRINQVSLRDQLQLFRRVCEAVHYAHQRGVIHRDLKPSNIIVDAAGNPKILDFGLARIGDPQTAVSTASLEIGRIMGTLPYMSPEQASSKVDEIDVRSDVYSLGVILYELLTRTLPHDLSRVMPHEALRMICEQPPRKPSTFSRALRGDLETIVLKALAKEPARRYDSPAALAEDVKRYLSNQPILARPPSFFYLLRKWVVRHQTFASLVVMLLIILAFAVALWIQSLRIAEAQEQIRRAELPTAEWIFAEQRRLAVQAERREFANELEARGLACLRHDQLVSAEALLRMCLEYRLDVLGASSGLTAYTQSVLGECLGRLGQYAEAERLLLQSYPLIRDDPYAADSRKHEAVQRIILFYEEWNKPAEADPWRAELERMRSHPSAPPGPIDGARPLEP